MSVPEPLKNIIEAALLAAGRPLSLDAMQGLFHEIECPSKKELREALQQLAEDYGGRGIEIAEVGSGWRIQVGEACSPWVSRLWDERPARYSRALMETLALIAYRQPITRGEIEDIRGVSVSTNIVKTLMEREWVHVVGQRDVPGKPSLYGTTREFLDYFGLKSLDDLPTLAELRDLDEINRELDLEDPDQAAQTARSDDADATQQTGEVDDADQPAEGNEETAEIDAEQPPVGVDVATEKAAEASTEPRSDEDAKTAADDAAAVRDDGDESSDAGHRDDGGSPCVARANEENAEILEADEDIQPVYARPSTVSDAADGTEPEVMPVVEPERT